MAICREERIQKSLLFAIVYQNGILYLCSVFSSEYKQHIKELLCHKKN
jgi:hypothetical protein